MVLDSFLSVIRPKIRKEKLKYPVNHNEPKGVLTPCPALNSFLTDINFSLTSALSRFYSHCAEARAVNGFKRLDHVKLGQKLQRDRNFMQLRALC